MSKKLLIITLTLVSVAFVGITGVKAVQAEGVGPYPSIVERLAEKFNLNEDEVQTFFNEAKQERHELILQNREERLNQAVSDGVITEEQKQALLDKWTEMQTQRE